MLVDDKKDSADFSDSGLDDGDRLTQRAAPRKVMMLKPLVSTLVGPALAVDNPGVTRL